VTVVQQHSGIECYGAKTVPLRPINVSGYQMNIRQYGKQKRLALLTEV